jgi:hypothetical protein
MKTRSRVRRVLVAVAAMLLAMIGIVGCDDRPCLRGHYMFVPVVHSTGKSTYTTITPVWVCDQYGEKKKS